MKNIDATAADSFHENEILDVETGTANTSAASYRTPPNESGSKRRIGLFALLFVSLVIISLSAVYLVGKDNGDGTTTVASEAGAVADTPIVEVVDDVSTTTTDTASPANNDEDSESSGSSNDATGPFEPEVETGDALLTLPEQVDIINNTTNSPTKSPVTDSPISSTPTVSPSSKPTLEPTKAPTNEPTHQPTPQPSNAPSNSPTKKPVYSIDLSVWNQMDWNFDPTISPSLPPTPKPTSLPTRQPTPQPSNLPTPQPSHLPTRPPITPSPVVYEPFFFGDEFIRDDDLDIDISKGLSVRVIAQTGEKVPYANGDESKDRYHTRSDAAGIINIDSNNPTESGYVYVVNSEEEDGGGGVYGIYFDKDGNVLEYKALLEKTTDNCGGGHTPWNTWISCEEYEDGQCWQIDPVNERVAETKLGGSGGRYESVAVDNRNPNAPIFFTTEDHERGALRRFLASGSGWDALHTNGETTFLNILDDNTFEWTDDEDEGRDSAERYFRNTEGVQVHEGKLYFMAKKDFKMLILDLDNMTYTTETTGKKFYGEGSFENQPDQNLFGPTRKYIYFTEDGGETPGVFARYGSDGTYFTLFQAVKGGRYGEDETVGIALSPDHKRFYAGIQDFGVIFEFTRDDGLPFE